MSTINIKFGLNYHVNVKDGVINVEYTDGNKLYCQEITNNEVKSSKVVDFCEERIVLNDSKVLKRVRDVLTIE